ncbi:RNase A-like domain-containing protein [Lyngbya aestuarii]|uniref:RNase A-like domain-containing protein n=1 Tax=Lyngbya aestuarii TaxID=118322 RepID=UPI00403DEA37
MKPSLGMIAKLLASLPLMFSATSCVGVGVSQSASTPCIPASFSNDWLQQQEQAGGHTIERHVGKSDQELVERLKKEPKIGAASTYPNLTTASTHLEAALTANAPKLNQWASSAAVGQKQVVDYNAHQVIGRVARRPPSLNNVKNAQQLRAVLTATGGGKCLLLTSYPN